MAREKANEYRKLLVKGYDPIELNKDKFNKIVTFDVTLSEWLKIEASNVTIRTLKYKRSRVESIYYPAIKNLSINSIDHFLIAN